MAPDIPLLSEKKEIESLVREREEAEGMLLAAGGEGYRFLLEDCSDLADIIDDIREISSKKGEKQHAAFETKVKFSRKIRRKAKDLKNFEQKLVFDYDNKRISLENGRKMVGIIKLCRSSDPEKARQEAEQFYMLLEADERLKMASDALERKKAQAERIRHGIAAQLSDLEWLGKEPPVHAEKAARHNEYLRLLEEIRKIRADSIISLKSMPLGALLVKIRDEQLGKLGFPQISDDEIASLAAFLKKSWLESKSAEQLFDMAGSSEQKLRHLGIDLAGFRQEILARTPFLAKIVSLQQSEFLADYNAGSPALAYLAKQSEEAAEAAARLAELHKTAEDDRKEWEMGQKIEEKKAELAGVEKSALENALHDIKELEGIMEGRLPAAPAQERKKGKGIFDSVLDLFKGK